MKTQGSCTKMDLLILLLIFAIPTNALSAKEKSRQEQEDETFVKNVQIATDPGRTPDEQYYDRFRIPMKQGRDFVVAQWREGGSFLGEAIDIFSVENVSGKLVGREVYSNVIGGQILLALKEDFDGDKQEDLILVHETGGNIATKGVLALRTASEGLSESLSYIGTDVLIYRDRGQLRIIVKERIAGQVQEFRWSPSKHTFQVTHKFELLY